jgi:hypothetical protein
MSNYEEVVRTLHGSHLYGLNTEESDKDYKGIFIPTNKREIMFGCSPKHIRNSTGNDASKNSSSDVDIELFSIYTFFEMCQKGEMIAIDMLHTPDNCITFLNNDLKHIWSKIRDNRSKFYSKDMKAYLGYIRKQTAKYGLKGTRMGVLEEILSLLKPYFSNPLNVRHQRILELKGFLPENDYCRWYTKQTESGNQVFYEVLGKSYQSTAKTIEMYNSLGNVWENYGERSRQAKNNKGVDWKAVSHAFRASLQLIEIYETGDIFFPLKEKKLLLDIKLGKLDFVSEVSPLLSSFVDKAEALSLQCEYPAKPDDRWWKDFVYDIYLQYSR